MREIGRRKETESSYVKLARKSLECFIKTGKHLGIDNESDIQRGVFVTLKKDGNLRGCIGTIEPTTSSVEREIVQNAVSAGVGDPRFNRVTDEELRDIVYSVDVLSEAEAVSTLKDLDINKYGVIVSDGFKRGLLLPNLEGIDTVEEQISIALDKAGIHPNEDYHIERFKVIRHH